MFRWVKNKKEYYIKALTPLLLFFAALTGTSQPPAGYYDTVENLTGKSLQKALHDIIGTHTVIPYNDLISCFRKTDVRNDSVVWDMYSDKPGAALPYVYYYGKGQECGNYDSEADCYNREHSFPKSWFNDGTPMISDLFHIYPTDGYVNNRRANYPFGETKSPTWVSKNGSKVGTSSLTGYAGIVFEPVDEYKGDFARTFFYMATRYYGEDTGWQGSDMVTGSQPKPWALVMLLNWHHKDPVSSKEINRNNEVFKLQKNRNPFIDFPAYADKTWTPNTYYLVADSENTSILLYPNPVEEILYVSFENRSQGNVTATISDMAGVILFSSGFESDKFKIPLNNIKSGIYILKVKTKSEEINSKFIKL